jgi:hypothetical protein
MMFSVEQYVENNVLAYFTTAIYYLLPAALPDSCGTTVGWDVKWSALSGSISKDKKPTLPKNLVWAFVLGIQSGSFLATAVHKTVLIDHKQRLELLRRIDRALTAKRAKSHAAKCSCQLICEARDDFILYIPLSDCGALEKLFRVDCKVALDQLFSFGHIDEVMLEEELGMPGYYRPPPQSN